MRTHYLDVLALQGIHAQSNFYHQFQVTDSIWFYYCGLVCLFPDLSLSNSHVRTCGRDITAIICHNAECFDPITISVIYAPATWPGRFSLFTHLVDAQAHTLFLVNPRRQIILGDFNYFYSPQSSSRSRSPQAPKVWLDYIYSNLIDSVTLLGEISHRNFCRGLSQSCIDFIFLSKYSASTRSLGQVHYIQIAWSDHFMVSLYLPLLAASNISSTQAQGKDL